METETASLPAVLNGSAITAYQGGGSLPMPVQVDLVVARVQAVQEIIARVFKEGVHFGVIPGTGPKKTLHKPGFDMLCLAFQFSPEFVKQPESVETDKMINVVYKCRLIHSPTGKVIATGDGSCNSKEEKYRWTMAARKCPECQGEFIRTSKPEDAQGFYCWKKLGGCGATFPKNHPPIVNQPEGRKENDNPWNHHNTLTKMAQKRAGMAAIITACGLSSDFTQDLEDYAETQRPAQGPQQEYAGEAEYSPAPQAQAPSQPAPGQAAASPAQKPLTPAEILAKVRSAVAECKSLANLAAVKEFCKEKGWFTEAAKEIITARSIQLQAEAKAAQAAAPTFTPEEIEKAVAGVLALTKSIDTREGYDALKANCQTEGGVFRHPDVVQAINGAYRAAFPGDFAPNAVPPQTSMLNTPAAA